MVAFIFKCSKMDTKYIDSIKNPFVKSLLQLKEKRKARQEQGLFLVEGFSETLLAIEGKYEIKYFLIQKDIFKQTAILKKYAPKVCCIFVSEKVYKKLALRTHSQGIIAVVQQKNIALENFNLPPKNPFILIAESIEKPGNLGAILRTADACGVDAVFISDLATDLYNPHIIRNSLGCIFTVPIFVESHQIFINFLNQNQIQIYASHLGDTSEDYLKQDYQKPCAIVVGNEHKGISKVWRSCADKKIMINMRGQIDSMNVSVAAAVLMFEVTRQRTA